MGTGVSEPAVHVNLKTTTAKQLTRQLSGGSQYLPAVCKHLSPLWLPVPAELSLPLGDSTASSKDPVSGGHR